MLTPHACPLLCVTPQELFAEYDVDSSGSISFDELATGLQRQGYNVNESEVRAANPCVARVKWRYSGGPKGQASAALVELRLLSPPARKARVGRPQLQLVRSGGARGPSLARR
jgi:hypothetical protein